MTALVLGLLRAWGRLVFMLGASKWVIGRRRRRARVLLYHACTPTESSFLAGLGSNTTPERFKEQLDFLLRHYEIVDLDTAISDDRPDAALTITFDDGYRSVCEHAFPALRERGLAATVFLISDAIGPGAMVWVNAVNHLTSTDGSARSLAAAGRSGSGSEILPSLIESLPSDEVDPLVDSLLAASGTTREELAAGADLFLTPDDIAEMAAGGITFGNHTATHPNLSQCTSERAQSEVARAHDALSQLPGFRPSFAFPFGYLSEDARSAASKLGYTSAMEVGGVNDRIDPMAIARFPVADQSAAALFAEIEFVEPFKAWVRGRRGDRSA